MPVHLHRGQPLQTATPAIRLLAWRSGALPVLALLAAATILLYWPARRCGLISDGWGLIWIGSLDLKQALSFKLLYHLIPVTNLLNWILWRTFGLWQPGYQLVNLAELGLAAWLLYFLGLRLFGRRRIALLAALLLLANASFYQVTFWPGVGNFQILAGLFQITGVMAALRAAEASRPAPWAILFGLLALLAFFTYEPAVSLLAAGVLAAALVPLEGESRSLRAMVWRSLPVLAAALLAFGCMLLGKLVLAGPEHRSMFLPGSWAEIRIRLVFLVRACLGLLTLRADSTVGHTLYYLKFFAANPPGLGSRAFELLLLAGWVGALGLGSLLVAWKARRPAVVFLFLWFWIYVLTVSVATIIESRMYFLAALSSSLLLAWAITSAADAAADLLARSAPAVVSASLAFLAFGFLAAGAKVDLNAAAALHREVTENHREIVALLRNRIASNAAPEAVVLVNMPVGVSRGGIYAPAFPNGIHAMLQLEEGLSFNRVQMVVAAGSEAGYVVTATMSLPELYQRVRNPRDLVVRYDRPSGHVVEMNRLTWSLPRGYTTAETPYLPWSDGPWPALSILAGQPLELPLDTPGTGAWGAVRLLRIPTTDLTVTQADAGSWEIRPQEITPHWLLLTFPLETGAQPIVLRLTSASGTQIQGLWTFQPPARYTPEAAPFLSWSLGGGEPGLMLDSPLRLPLSAPECAAAPCVVRIEYMGAPGRGLALQVGGGAKRAAVTPAAGARGWRTIELPVAAAPVTVLHIEPRGAPPLFLRSVALAGAASSLPASGTDILQELRHDPAP